MAPYYAGNTSFGSHQIQGEKQMRKVMKTLGEKVQSKLLKASLRASGSVAAKEMKKLVPSRYKRVRKAVGWKMTSKKGEGLLRVGSKVGKKKTWIVSEGRAITAERRAAGKKGFGVSPATLHWAIMGNRQGFPRLLDGVVKDGWQRAQKKISDAAVKSLIKGVKREVAKARASP